MKNVWSPSHLFLASSFCLTVSDYIGNVHCPPDKSKHLTQTDFCRQKNFLLPGKKDPCCQAKNGSIMIYTGSFLRNIFLYFSLNLLPQWCIPGEWRHLVFRKSFYKIFFSFEAFVAVVCSGWIKTCCCKNKSGEKGIFMNLLPQWCVPWE